MMVMRRKKGSGDASLVCRFVFVLLNDVCSRFWILNTRTVGLSSPRQYGNGQLIGICLTVVYRFVCYIPHKVACSPNMKLSPILSVSVLYPASRKSGRDRWFCVGSQF